MVVHDDVESEPALTPSKEGTLIVRQVPLCSARLEAELLLWSLTHLLIHSLMLFCIVICSHVNQAWRAAGLGCGRQACAAHPQGGRQRPPILPSLHVVWQPPSQPHVSPAVCV